MKAEQLLLISCEHGGNRIPAAYRHFFASQDAVLDSHRGFDAGALSMAEAIAHELHAVLVTSTTSRLLIDLNRSPHHRHLYSDILLPADAATRAAIFRRHYLPYRRRIERIVADAIAAGGTVLHISCHSFTPVLEGEIRRADIGLLYDPARVTESRFCRAWQAQLLRCAPQLTIRLNYPYRGKADGLTTHLRRQHAEECYRGIELEINQAQITADSWSQLQEKIITALHQAITEEKSCRAPGAQPGRACVPFP